ncbi:MAG: hypothetical protein N3D13_11345, partial [Thermaurantimonas aggregans]|nr:hypothetical protein [Thermaurantimonas aggregans]
GTQLSYSDLLLSIATVQWDAKDAREEIINFVDEINGIGRGFSFNKDFELVEDKKYRSFYLIKIDDFYYANVYNQEEETYSIYKLEIEENYLKIFWPNFAYFKALLSGLIIKGPQTGKVLKQVFEMAEAA